MWLILAESDILSDHADAVSHVLEAPFPCIRMMSCTLLMMLNMLSVIAKARAVAAMKATTIAIMSLLGEMMLRKYLMMQRLK